MAGKIVADTLEHSTAGSIATNYVVEGSAKAWANNKMQFSASVLDSFNQSSISDDAQGKLTMSFSTALGNANYSVSGMSRVASGATAYASCAMIGNTTKTSSQLEVHFAYANAGSHAYYDVPESGVSINGDLA